MATNKYYEKKLELIKNKESRVVFCNSSESLVMLEIYENLNKVFRHNTKFAGLSFPMETGTENRKNFLFVAKGIEDFIISVASDIGVKNIRPSGTLKSLVKYNKDN